MIHKAVVDKADVVDVDGSCLYKKCQQLEKRGRSRPDLNLSLQTGQSNGQNAFRALTRGYTVYGKTFEGENFRGCAQNTLFTGKLSRCIRPMPLYTVHSK